MSDASSGNRTRAARVAGEHSTTEPTMLLSFCYRKIDIGNKSIGHKPSWFDIDTKLNPFPNAIFPRYNSWYNGITSHQDRLPSLIRWIPARYRILTATLRIPITNMTLHRGLVLINWFHVCSLWLTWPESREGRLKMGRNTKKQYRKTSRSVGFEPTPAERNWFLVSRLNHSATTASRSDYAHRQCEDLPSTLAPS